MGRSSGIQLPDGPTALVAGALERFVRGGDRVLDATAGNGHDTSHLAALVGSTGRVWALDLQPEALESTARRLQQEDRLDRVTLIGGNHADLDSLLPEELRECLAAIVFNLGYLPGGNPRLITTAESTVAALGAARNWLAPGGLLAVTVYPGHEGGALEAATVDAWVRQLPRKNWTVWSACLGNASERAPRTHFIQKLDLAAGRA